MSRSPRGVATSGCASRQSTSSRSRNFGSAAHARGARKSAAKFGHGVQSEIGRVTLFDSYHCSRYNTNTGVLTPEMFRAVFAAVRGFIDGDGERRTA